MVQLPAPKLIAFTIISSTVIQGWRYRLWWLPSPAMRRYVKAVLLRVTLMLVLPLRLGQMIIVLILTLHALRPRGCVQDQQPAT